MKIKINTIYFSQELELVPEKQIHDKITAPTKALSLQLIIYQGLFLSIYVFSVYGLPGCEIPRGWR